MSEDSFTLIDIPTLKYAYYLLDEFINGRRFHENAAKDKACLEEIEETLAASGVSLYGREV